MRIIISSFIVIFLSACPHKGAGLTPSTKAVVTLDTKASDFWVRARTGQSATASIVFNNTSDLAAFTPTLMETANFSLDTSACAAGIAPRSTCSATLTYTPKTDLEDIAALQVEDSPLDFLVGENPLFYRLRTTQYGSERPLPYGFTQKLSALPKLTVNDITQDGAGRYWLATIAGIAVSADMKSWQMLTTTDGLASNTISQIHAQGNVVWIKTDVGWAVSGNLGKTWHDVHVPNFQRSPSFLSQISVFDNARFYITESDGLHLYYLQGEELKNTLIAETQLFNKTMFTIEDGVLYQITDKRLSACQLPADPNNGTALICEELADLNTLEGEYISSYLVVNKHVYVATDTKTYVKNLSTTEGDLKELLDYQLYDLHVLAGVLYGTDNDRQLVSVNGVKTRIFESPLEIDRIFMAHNELFIYTNATGLFRLENDALVQIPSVEIPFGDIGDVVLEEGKLRAVAQSFSDVWLSQNNDGIFTKIPPLDTNINRLLYHDGLLYIATDDGLWFYKVSDQSLFQVFQGSHIIDIALWKDGLYFAEEKNDDSDNNGVWQYDPNAEGKAKPILGAQSPQQLLLSHGMLYITANEAPFTPPLNGIFFPGGNSGQFHIILSIPSTNNSSTVNAFTQSQMPVSNDDDKQLYRQFAATNESVVISSLSVDGDWEHINGEGETFLRGVTFLSEQGGILMANTLDGVFFSNYTQDDAEGRSFQKWPMGEQWLGVHRKSLLAEDRTAWFMTTLGLYQTPYSVNE